MASMTDGKVAPQTWGIIPAKDDTEAAKDITDKSIKTLTGARPFKPKRQSSHFFCNVVLQNARKGETVSFPGVSQGYG